VFSRPAAEAPPMSRRQEIRVFLGFLVQPLVAAIFGFVVFLLFVDDGQSLAPSNSTVSGSVHAARAFGLGTGLVAFFVTPLLALPLFVWMRRRWPITLGRTLVCGAVLGNVLTVPMLFVLTIRGVVFGTAVGMFCAAVFWWIAGRHLQPR
jgi:hypothetical protein